MFNKLKEMLGGSNTKTESSAKLKPYLHPHYDQRVNYNPDVENNSSMKKLDAYNKKGDKQLEKLQKADADLKDGKTEAALKVYHKIIVEDGLCINSQSYAIGYLNNLYKLERYDEAWGITNQYALKYPGLEKKVQDFRVKLLKKEKRFKDALYHQVLAIIFDNVHYREMPQDSYEKKYMMLLKKLKQEDKANEVQELINTHTRYKNYDVRLIRDSLAEIIISE